MGLTEEVVQLLAAMPWITENELCEENKIQNIVPLFDKKWILFDVWKLTELFSSWYKCRRQAGSDEAHTF